VNAIGRFSGLLLDREQSGNPLGWKTRYSLKCQSNLVPARFKCNTSNRVLCALGTTMAGSRSDSWNSGRTDRGPRIQQLCAIRRKKVQHVRPHNAKSRMERPAFAKHLQRMVAGVRFELTTFGLCDLTQLSLRVGLYLHPVQRDARHPVSTPSSIFRGLVRCCRSATAGFRFHRL